ncbi:MAG: FliA/WhiG family RNA polymerase sigma factor [Oscillospiraceae bacterium]|nr:FliA/WhiG family RNA polymerase sigma factor [Oscillospiraceae bacterium]
MSKPAVKTAYADMSVDELFEEYRRNPNDELKWEIVMRHSGIVRNIALQIQGVYCTFAQLDDIINEGLITMAKAVDKYDPSIGKFETYIAKRIRGMIIDLARQQDWVPRPIRRRAKEIERANSELYNQYGRFPTDLEVAQYLGISEEEYQETMSNSSMYSVVSLEETLEGYEQITGPDETAADMMPEASLERTEMLDELTDAIASLRENEQIVLSLYYQKDMKMKDIAEILGVSHARASQIHTRAIQKLKVLMAP